MPFGPVTIEAPVTRRRLLFELLDAMRYRARAWRVLLLTTPELLAFVALSVVCTAAMIRKNFQNAGALAFYPPFLILALPLIYGGVFFFMYFPAAFSYEEGRATPRARWPRMELALMLLYTVAFLNAGTWMRQHGHGDWLVARWHLWFANELRSVHEALFHFYRPGVINIYAFFAVPLIALLLLGNRPRDLGFRTPVAPPGLLIGFITLFVYAIAAQTHGPLTARLFAGAAALFGAGLPEEFLYRAVIQTRLEAVLKSPIRAIVITSLLFGAVHLVAHEREGIVWQLTNAFGMKALLGLVFGHLYYRTRSLWPGMFLHATIDVAFFARIL